MNCVRLAEPEKELLDEVKMVVNNELKNGWEPDFRFKDTPPFTRCLHSYSIVGYLLKFKDDPKKVNLGKCLAWKKPFQLDIGPDNQVV